MHTCWLDAPPAAYSETIAPSPSIATCLPADEIIGLDLTADGGWVLATCRQYLLVISTLTPDAKSTGFESRLGKDKVWLLAFLFAGHVDEGYGGNHLGQNSSWLWWNPG